MVVGGGAIGDVWEGWFPVASGFALVRYDAAGALDTAFGDGGVAVTRFFGGPDQVTALIVQPDGTLVAAGVAAPQDTNVVVFALAAYAPDGSPDTTFGGGRATSGSTFAEGSTVTAVAVQADGKIVEAGYCGAPLVPYSDCIAPGALDPSNQNLNFTLIRYAADGRLDLGFGVGGRTITDFDGAADKAAALVVQPDAKLVSAVSIASPCAN